MSWGAILGAITALSTIVGGVVYIFKYSTWLVKKTPEQKSQDIAVDEQSKEQAAKDTGRPQ